MTFVDVRIPVFFRIHTGGAATVVAAGVTVFEVLMDLVIRFPGLSGQLIVADGKLNEALDVYVNNDEVFSSEQLVGPIKTGDVVSIIPSLATGVQAAIQGSKVLNRCNDQADNRLS
jgi:molybdopterin converting factor small subunit